MVAPTSVRPSVRKATSETLGLTEVTMPTSAAPALVPATTGELRTTPSDEPTSICALRYQSVIERPMTRPFSRR